MCSRQRYHVWNCQQHCCRIKSCILNERRYCGAFGEFTEAKNRYRGRRSHTHRHLIVVLTCLGDEKICVPPFLSMFVAI